MRCVVLRGGPSPENRGRMTTFLVVTMIIAVLIILASATRRR